MHLLYAFVPSLVFWTTLLLKLLGKQHLDKYKFMAAHTASAPPTPSHTHTHAGTHTHEHVHAHTHRHRVLEIEIHHLVKVSSLLLFLNINHANARFI